MTSPLAPLPRAKVIVGAPVAVFTVNSVSGLGPCWPLTAYRTPFDRKAKLDIAWPPTGPTSVHTPVTGFTVTSRRAAKPLAVCTMANSCPSLGRAASANELNIVKPGRVTCTLFDRAAVARWT